MTKSSDTATNYITHASFGAIFGGIAGGVLFINGLGLSTSSAIHQIYRVLSVGMGAQLITLASIAQHSKGVRKD